MGTGAKLLFFSKYVFNLSQKSLFNKKTTQQGGWGPLVELGNKDKL